MRYLLDGIDCVPPMVARYAIGEGVSQFLIGTPTFRAFVEKASGYTKDGS